MNRPSSTLSPVLSMAERSSALIARTYSSRAPRMARPSAGLAKPYAEARAASPTGCAWALRIEEHIASDKATERSAVPRFISSLSLLLRGRMNVVHPVHLLRLLDHRNIEVHDHGLLAAPDEHA